MSLVMGRGVSVLTIVPILSLYIASVLAHLFYIYPVSFRVQDGRWQVLQHYRIG
jgi:hypothetical protein